MMEWESFSIGLALGILVSIALVNMALDQGWLLLNPKK